MLHIDKDDLIYTHLYVHEKREEKIFDLVPASYSRACVFFFFFFFHLLLYTALGDRCLRSDGKSFFFPELYALTRNKKKKKKRNDGCWSFLSFIDTYNNIMCVLTLSKGLPIQLSLSCV